MREGEEIGEPKPGEIRKRFVESRIKSSMSLRHAMATKPDSLAREQAGAVMNHLEKIAPIHAQVLDNQVAETIARETGAPIELATRIYNEELRDLARDARIAQFVNVLASRRARLKLEQQRDRRAAV